MENQAEINRLARVRKNWRIFIICGLVGLCISMIEKCNDSGRSPVPDHIKGTEWDWSIH